MTKSNYRDFQAIPPIFQGFSAGYFTIPDEKVSKILELQLIHMEGIAWVPARGIESEGSLSSQPYDHIDVEVHACHYIRFDHTENPTPRLMIQTYMIPQYPPTTVVHTPIIDPSVFS